MNRSAVAQVRGVLADRVVVCTTLDPFLPLKALAGYCGLSIRKLRDCLEHPQHPLPCYRVGGKILVGRSEFDAWISAYRNYGRADVDERSSPTCSAISHSAARSSMRATRPLTAACGRV
jgi:hypothetical protein